MSDHPADNSQSVKWRMRLVEWIVPRLSGSDEEKKVAVDMITNSVAEATYEGIADAADMVERMANEVPGERGDTLAVAAKALRLLAQKNRQEMHTSMEESGGHV